MEKHTIAHTIDVDFGTVSFKTQEFYFDVKMKKDGKLEVRCSDGALAVFARSSNMIEMRCEPWWPDKDAARVAKHIIDNNNSEEAAEKIVDALRGRNF